MSKNRRTSIIWKLSNDEIKKLIDGSGSFAEILRKIGFIENGVNYKTLYKRIIEANIDLEKVKDKYRQKNRDRVSNSLGVSIPLEKILTKNSNYSRGSLKRRLLKNKILENICQQCELSNEWNGEPLSLHLDHINGISNDNRLENLRMLCPNCHSQTKTYAGKRNKKQFYCKKCSKPISRNTLTGKCLKCAQQDRSDKRNPKKPSKEELIDLITKHPMTHLGEMFRVSDNAVRKWAKSYGLETRKPKRVLLTITCPTCRKEFKQKNEEQVCCSKICSGKRRRVVKWPTKEELTTMIKHVGIKGVAKQYNIDASSIHGWIKHYGIKQN